MTDVYAWPPVGLTGWELTTLHSSSRSVGLIDGRTRTSSAQRSRRLATAVVSGIGDDDAAGAGYVYMLADQMKVGPGGSRHLVRVPALAPVWHLAADLDLQNAPMQWMSGGSEMQWTSGGAGLIWSDNLAMTGEPRTDNGWPALRVEGLPKNTLVARPSDRITVTDADGNVEASRVLTVAWSGGLGGAKIRVRDAFTLSGLVSIGGTESIVFEALNHPRAVQPAGGDYSFEWRFREVFRDEYPGGWTEIDPWR